MNQVKSVLAEVDAKIDEVENKLESDDVEPDTLQVNDLLNFFKVHIKVPRAPFIIGPYTADINFTFHFLMVYNFLCLILLNGFF